jgi:hypothetical protein
MAAPFRLSLPSHDGIRARIGVRAMNKVLEIGAYVLASAVALGGGFVGAELIFADGNAAGTAAVTTEREAPPAKTAELRSDRYGFAFRYPEDWGQGPRYHPSVRESVGRRDGVFCYVSVFEKPVASGADGTPKDLRRLMNGLTAAQFEKMAVPGAATKVDSFGKATLGGQDARSFVIDAKGAEGAAMRHGKLQGYATLRHFGAVFLICVAPIERHSDADVQAAFRTAHATFKFIAR